MTQSISPIPLGTRITSSVIPNIAGDLQLDQSDRDKVNEDLGWLFAAADHCFKVARSEIGRGEPVPRPIPVDATRSPEANNSLLKTLDDSILLPIWQLKLEQTILKPIEYNLSSLVFLREREAQRGEDGRYDLTLQKEIDAHQLEIVRFLVLLANFTERAYGVFVTSPSDLIDLLEGV